MTTLALDTSVAIPLVVQTHRHHDGIVGWWKGREAHLSGHALAETYSVLTRLPGDLRVSSLDAAQLLRERFAAPLVLGRRTSARLPEILSELKVAGGAVYDALVALAALEHGAQLATRDARAQATYETVGVSVLVAEETTRSD